MDVALKEYIDRLFEEQEKQNIARYTALEKLVLSKFEAMNKAIDKSDKAYDARFLLANEFRQAMSDLTATFITREAESIIHKEQERRMNSVERSISKMDGRTIGYSAGIGLVVLIISIVIQFVNL
jgi:hypothetical protein